MKAGHFLFISFLWHSLCHEGLCPSTFIFHFNDYISCSAVFLWTIVHNKRIQLFVVGGDHLNVCSYGQFWTMTWPATWATYLWEVVSVCWYQQGLWWWYMTSTYLMPVSSESIWHSIQYLSCRGHLMSILTPEIVMTSMSQLLTHITVIMTL